MRCGVLFIVKLRYAKLDYRFGLRFAKVDNRCGLRFALMKLVCSTVKLRFAPSKSSCASLNLTSQSGALR